MAEWDGVERRKKDRRIEGHCALHSTLWEHHDKDALEHRQIVCGKISRVEREVKRLEAEHREDLKTVHESCTPRALFFWVMGGMFVSLIGMFYQNYTISDKIGMVNSHIGRIEEVRVDNTYALKESIKDIQLQLHAIATRIDALEARAK